MESSAAPDAHRENPKEDNSESATDVVVVERESYPQSATENFKIVATLALAAWAILRLFVHFGDYDYYYGVSYVFDLAAIYILFRVATMKTKRPRTWFDVVKAYQKEYHGNTR